MKEISCLFCQPLSANPTGQCSQNFLLEEDRSLSTALPAAHLPQNPFPRAPRQLRRQYCPEYITEHVVPWRHVAGHDPDWRTTLQGACCCYSTAGQAILPMLIRSIRVPWTVFQNHSCRRKIPLSVCHEEQGFGAGKRTGVQFQNLSLITKYSNLLSIYESVLASVRFQAADPSPKETILLM